MRLSCSVRQPVSGAADFVQKCRDAEAIQDSPIPIEGIPANRRFDAGLMIGAGVRLGVVGLGLRWTQSLVVTFPEARFGGIGATWLSGGRYSTLSAVVDVAGRL